MKLFTCIFEFVDYENFESYLGAFVNDSCNGCGQSD